MNHSNVTARVLALDLATTTGWAMLANGVITSGSHNFSRHAGNKSRQADHPGASFAMFRRWLHAKLLEAKPESIAYEEVNFFKFAFQAYSFCGLRGVMYEIAATANIPLRGHKPNKIKEYWAGRGGAKKPEMIAATLQRFPELDLTDDNEADGIAILHLDLSKS